MRPDRKIEISKQTIKDRSKESHDKGYQQCKQDVINLIEKLCDKVEDQHLMIGFQESMLLAREQVAKL